ncbi:MAG: DUF1566 domain-containing protein [Deltaproteobacteria bacterium]|nr:DUF1566 domain-containing protein [Deltaproteobacteria bacterium]
MNRNTGRVSPYLLAVFMMGCLFCYSSFPTYADELPASHPSCVTCKGQLSPLGRWCDNNNGTVTDMSNGLVWLKDAGWGGRYPFWTNTKTGTSAADRAAQVQNGNPASLSDGSQEGAWRLPTLVELKALHAGPEAVRDSAMYSFTGVQSDVYWSSTTVAVNTSLAWIVDLGSSLVNGASKASGYYVWPVRGGQ